MRLGLFGGTFDPVHYGHLLLAEACREACRLDRVWFMPTAISPHKRDQATATAADRVAMLRLAVGGHSAFEVCELELDRGGVSYTVDTLTHLKAEEPERELFLLLGSDSLADLPHWREPAEICALAMPVVVARPGAPEPDYAGLTNVVSAERLAEIRRHRVEMPAMDLSSRDIRRRVAEGRSIRYMTPQAVEKYIETTGLYRGW